jgi:hypothetical protein
MQGTMLRVITGLVCLLIGGVAEAAPLFEPTVAPSRALDGIRPGMALDEAKAALGAYRLDDAYRDAAARQRLVRDAGAGAQFYVLVKDGVISRIGIEAPQRGLVEKLTRLWGKPARTTNLANESLASWSTASWRVDLACRAPACRIAFHRPFSAAYLGASAHPPGPLAPVRPWMQRAELARLVPQFVTGSELPAGPEDVRLALDLARDGRLRSILVGGLPENARDVITQAWGTPDGLTWWNPNAGWRAQLDVNLRTLQLFPYVPAAKLLGGGVGIAALARPILGARRDQIAQAYPAPLALPPIEDGVGPTPVAIDFDPNGRARKLVIKLPFATPTRRDELVKLLEAKWGTARRGAGTYTFPTSKLRIEARETPATLVLTLAL